MVTFPYNTTDFAFTLDNVFIEFTSANNSYFTVEILIKYYDFYSETEQQKTLEYKIPLFNGAASWFVGNIIDRNISKYNGSFTDGFQQKTTLVSFTILELDLDDDSTLETITLNDVQFIAGKTPKVYENGIAFLTTRTTLSKIAKTNKINLNLLLPNETHQLKIFKEGGNNPVETIEIESTGLNNVYSKEIDISSYNLKTGDALIFKINDSSNFKQYVVFNERQNNTIQFVNGYNRLNSLAVFGDYVFSTTPTQTTHTYKKQNVEKLEIVEVVNSNFLTINTGMLFKDQLHTIDDLLDAKKVFINNIEGYHLELVPVTKKRTGFDSETNEYSYSLEFRINTKTDA